eukprot:PhM_4_TR11258/c0_g1_i1/m.69958/K02998/RP-SAe, RPSA; small subunit ribosomal protein SAe
MSLQICTEDVQRFVSCKTHIGTKNMTKGMERYVAGTKKDDGINIINLHATWEKIVLAARVIVAIENPQDVFACSSRLLGQRAVLKFGHYTGSQYYAGRFMPGKFTNQTQKTFQQPRLLIVTDPRTDHQAILEASYVNIPVIALCDTDAPLSRVDIAIPCNNRNAQSIALVWWMLTREVMRMRGRAPREVAWDVAPDLFLYRDPDEILKKKEDAAKEAADETAAADNWGAEAADNTYNWDAEQ